MADPTTGRGFLAELGLTDLSEEQASQARQRAQFGIGVQAAAAGIDSMPGISPAERDARKVGAILGNFFGSRKFAGGGQINDQEKAGITAVQSAQEKLTELKKVTPGMTQEMASEKFKQILAGELALVGQVQQSMEVGKAAEQEYRARKTQELELKRLGLGADRDDVALTLEEGKAARDLRGQVNPVWKKGATREDEAIMGFMKNDGTVVGSDGEEIPLGEYSIFPPPTPANNGRPLTANDLGISDREQASIRNQAGAMAAMARGAVDMRDALAEASQLGAGVNIMDGSGKATGAFTKILEITSGLARTINATLDVLGPNGVASQGDLSQGPAASSWIDGNFDEMDERLFDLVPDHLNATAASRAKYYSALTRITFAQARSNEPGAKQLSDEDFKRALVQMAGNAANPEAFRQVMVNNMRENVAAMEMRSAMIGPERMDLILYPAGKKLLEKEMNRFASVFGKVGDDTTFGTAAQPSRELTGRGRTPAINETQPQGGGATQFDIIHQPRGVIKVGGGTFTPTGGQ